MLFSPRISTKQLAGICRRWATALGAGIDLRTVLDREASHASGRATRVRLQSIATSVNRGGTLSAALAACGDFFPPLMKELVEVAEQTGHLSEIFARLADHYEGRIKLRRTFFASIAWPVLELTAAIVVIGLFILALGVIENITGSRIDPLGWGLIGVRGLIVYVAVLAALAVLLLLVVQAIRRGVVWTRPIQRAVLRLPVLGKALQTIALARLTWTMHLTLNTEMDVRRSLQLSLASTRNARYTDLIKPIDAQIEAGQSIYKAFYTTGGFPNDLLDAIAVGEQSGRIVESMATLSRNYEDQARMAMVGLSALAGLAVFVIVAAVIIFVIIQMALFYIGTINDVLSW